MEIETKECNKERDTGGKDEHTTYLGTFLINIQVWGRPSYSLTNAAFSEKG